MKCLTLTPPFTRDELITRGLSPDAADELVLFSTRLLERHSRRQASPGNGVAHGVILEPHTDDRGRDASPHRFGGGV